VFLGSDFQQLQNSAESVLDGPQPVLDSHRFRMCSRSVVNPGARPPMCELGEIAFERAGTCRVRELGV